MLHHVAAVSEENTAFDPAALQRLPDGRYAQTRRRISDVMSRPELAPVVALPTSEYRERVLEWAKSTSSPPSRATTPC
jgi:hypothetical protein